MHKSCTVIVNFWIVYRKLAQPTEPERLGNSQTNRAPFNFYPFCTCTFCNEFHTK